MHAKMGPDLNPPKNPPTELRPAHDDAQAIVDGVPPLLILDKDLRVRTANKSFYEYFRVSPAQTENCPLYELGNGQWNIPALRTWLAQAPRQNSFQDLKVAHEFEFIGHRTVLLGGRWLDGLSGILLFIHDITEQMASQALMRTSEIRYRRLFEAARDGILIVDPATRLITDANPFMSELLGYTLDELLGKELWEIGLMKDEGASREAFEHLQRNNFIRYENLPLQTKAGRSHEVEFVSNVYEEAGRQVIQCNIRDITERRALEKELRNANLRANAHLSEEAAELERVVVERTRQLQETIGELEAFSYSVSHDMRAPLRAMQGFSEILLDEYADKLDEQGTRFLRQIMQSAVRLDHLIKDVLSYTRILKAKLPFECVDLDGLVRQIVATFPNGKPVKPDILITGMLPKVVANEALLGQCISNLLSNGVKFVLSGTIPRVEISAQNWGDASVRLSFKDNGIGIASQDHDRIFRLFERIHPATEYEGTGIGLSIVRKATERMGATVGFESAPGEGSNFWIQLPKA